jgi:multiple sugar transport system ATP-binding protein
MRGELKAICAEKQATVVHVTHDYKEAMALSDRIAILQKGKLMQLDTPEKVYHQPANEFVASFLGDPPMSFLDGQLERIGDALQLRAANLCLAVPADAGAEIEQKVPEGKVRIGVRATDLTTAPEQTASCTVPTAVYVVETFGYRNIITCDAQGAGLVQAVSSPFVRVRPKDQLWLDLSFERIHLFGPDGAALVHPSTQANV